MGLLDFLTSAKPTAASVDGEAPVAQSGLMSKLNYGGVPFGIRLMAAAEALRTIENPDISRPSLALLARAKEKSDEAKKLEEERKKKQEKADRLAEKLQLTNPEVAELIRANPDLVDEYGKGSIADTFESKRSARDRAYQVEDREAGADLTREGWAAQAGLQEDRQSFETEQEKLKAQLEADKIKAKQAYDEARAKGLMDQANMIAQGFFMDTGEELDPTNPVATQPAMPQPIPVPEPGTITPTPEVVPGLTRQPVPGAPPPPGVMPEEQGDAEPASPVEVTKFRQMFKDPDLSETEASMIKAAMIAKLSADAAEGKVPDLNGAVGKASEVYQDLLKMRTERQKADAATSEADTKATEAELKQRKEAAEISEKKIASAEGNAQTADNVLNAVSKIEEATDPKNEDWLPATGMGSGLAGYVGDTKYTGNARAVFSAVDTIKANLGFAELKKMRDESPTGGALGQVAVQELEMLQATVAKLDQTDANFQDNVARVKELYTAIKQRNADYAEDIKNLRRFPSDENKAEFDEMYGVDAHLKFMGE
jgi:hypothetical protein